MASHREEESCAQAQGVRKHCGVGVEKRETHNAVCKPEPHVGDVKPDPVPPRF